MKKSRFPHDSDVDQNDTALAAGVRRRTIGMSKTRSILLCIERARLGLHAGCGGCCGAVLGAVDALIANSGPAWRVLAVGAGVGGTAGFLAGALLGLGAACASVARRTLGISLSAWRSAVEAANARRWAAGALGWIAFLYPLHVSTRIQIASLRATVLALGAAASIALALVVGRLLEAIVPQRLGAARGRVRSSTARAARFAVATALPATCVSVALIAVYGVELGSLRRLLALIVFGTLEHTACLLLKHGRHRQAYGGVLVLFLPICVAVAQVPLATPDAAKAAKAFVLPDCAEVLRRLTDFDHDGFSGLFGGRDCAPFDGRRYPGAREEPGNGIDEDCDGVDVKYRSSPAAVLPTFSSHEPPINAPFNVLLYVVDSLRPDHLKPYGYAFDTSPTFTRLAGESWLFEDAQSQSSTTALSMPSLLTGKNPSALNWKRGILPVAIDEGPTLALLFARQGYLTGLAVNSWVRDNVPSIQAGFEQVLVSPPDVDWRSGDYLLSNVVELVERARAATKPFFVVAHVDDVHHPYVSAEGKATQTFGSPGEQQRYDAGIAVFDQGLRAAIAHLRKVGAWERTVLIVTADHGEEFGEHGGTVHSRTCYAESSRVPLLIRVPNSGPRRVQAPVALVDIAPTLVEFLGGRRSAPPLDGQSLLVPLFEPAAVATDRAIFCTICQVLAGRPAFFTRSVRRTGWSLIEDVDTGRVELYDRHLDPRETTNLAGKNELSPTIVELRRILSVTEEGNLLRVSRGLL